jgi:hypothetical protein
MKTKLRSGRREASSRLFYLPGYLITSGAKRSRGTLRVRSLRLCASVVELVFSLSIRFFLYFPQIIDILHSFVTTRDVFALEQ